MSFCKKHPGVELVQGTPRRFWGRSVIPAVCWYICRMCEQEEYQEELNEEAAEAMRQAAGG